MDDDETPRSPRLHAQLTISDLHQIYDIFKEHLHKQLKPEELRKLITNYGIKTTDAQFKRLFLSLNTNRDNLCSWDEFVSHLVHGFRDEETYEHDKPLGLAIERPPKIIKSMHRYPIVKIRFCPNILPGRIIDKTSGYYITCSKDGTLINWTQEFSYQTTNKSSNRKWKRGLRGYTYL